MGRWMLLLGSIVFQVEAADMFVSMEIKRSTCDMRPSAGWTMEQAITAIPWVTLLWEQ